MQPSWQAPSRLFGLSLVFPLRVEIETDRIRDEVLGLLGKLNFGVQMGPHHNGRWKRIGLVGPSGDPDRTYPRGDEPAAKTPVLKALPAVERLFDSFEGPIRAASLSWMEPGAKVQWHRDTRQSADLTYARLHVPVITNPGAQMTLGHQTLQLTEGRLWYGDFAFPHTLQNDSRDGRLHIMFDVPAGPDLLRVFPDRFARERLRRRAARKAAVALFERWQARSEEGRYAEAFRAARDAAIKRGEDFVPPPRLAQDA